MKPSWLDIKEYPFAPHYFETEGQQMHFVDEGSGETILFVHGTPSWSFDYRQLIKQLRKNYRCVAIDHIGFGLSDKPPEFDYRTEAHSRRLEAFVLAKKLKDITLVVHDFGGPIALSMAIRQAHLVKRLVIFNSWLWSAKNEPEFIKLSKTLRHPLLPFLYRYFNFSPRVVLPASFGRRKLNARLLKHYTKPFAGPSQRHGALAFVFSLLNDQDWFEELWNRKEAICNKATLFIWGMKDPVIKPIYLQKFKTGFKNPEVVCFDDCGHFPQEERADEALSAIITFLENSEKTGDLD